VPEDARGHFLSETGQAQPGTLGEAKPVALKDRRGGETRSSIAGKARRRGTGLPGKRHRRTWKREDAGETREIQDQERGRIDAAGKPGASSLARPMDWRVGETRNFVAGADEFCGTGETRTTQKEAKLEEAGDGATRRLL
jgi:hypothetical protein